MKKDWVVSTPAQLRFVLTFMQQFKLNRVIKITVEHWNATRTIEQNSRYWSAIVVPAANEIGCSSDDLHEDLLCDRFGYTEHRLPSGRIKRNPLRRSSDLDKKEFSEYMDWAEGYLAEKIGFAVA